MTVTAEGSRLGIEVKASDLRKLVEQRGSVDWQLLDRMPGLEDAVSGEVALPRDNPIKDFLRSEDSKRAGFRAADAASQSGAGHRWTTTSTNPSAHCSRPARDC
jgi:predicted ABC-type transport system involved in lysophospholipase L1 biosynthesis ATPase subunit